MPQIPLAVDLDGTLIHSDMLIESALSLAKHKPLLLAKLPVWLSQGKAYLKAEIAKNTPAFDPALLPYNEQVLELIKKEKASGREIILCTASDQKIASAIAGYLGLFDQVFASDGKTNLSGKNKADFLVQKFGKQGFDYIGNSSDDIAVWEKAKIAYTANTQEKTIRRMQDAGCRMQDAGCRIYQKEKHQLNRF